MFSINSQFGVIMFYPIRNQIDWEYFGPPGPHPDIDGVCGRRVRIHQSKNLSKYERILARWMKAPEGVNRNLDSMNSLLWELMDGSRSFIEICNLMESTYHERILPTQERVLASIDQLIDLGFVSIISSEDD